MKCFSKDDCGDQIAFNGTNYWFTCEGKSGWDCTSQNDCSNDTSDGPWKCADWVLNHQTAFSKCSDDCEGDDSYNNIEYNIRCTGLVGSSCETSEDCDSDRNITCSDKWNNKTLAYSNEPKCIEWEQCN